MLEPKKQDNFLHSLKERQNIHDTHKNRSPFKSNGNNLLDDALSAKTVLTNAQKITIVCILIISVAACIIFTEQTIFLVGLVLSFFYLLVVLFRTAVLWDFDKEPIETLPRFFENQIPEKPYLVLAALYKEESQVAGLVAALDKIKWPRELLQICLLCEENDTATINAIKQIKLPKSMSLIVCPNGTPQTKPRALNYGLQLCSNGIQDGYLVIYDAEDRPHPNQLLEAHHTFTHSSDELVCLQAPLVVDNVNQSLLTKMFAIEYTTLFSGILLSLARWKAPMPLGGTSNHFKIKNLIEAGGWDAYNVTEDADLGIRLARKGFYCATIKSPTYEEAPVNFKDWLPQRTRWLKGWMQTLLVHLRSPKKLRKELGWKNYFLFHMILTSIVVSVIVHPIFIVGFGIQIYNFLSGHLQNQLANIAIAISTFTLLTGYLTYGLLAFAVLPSTRSKINRLWLLALPFYWLLISIAGWRAVFQLFTSPHKWEKTEHGKTTRATPNI